MIVNINTTSASDFLKAHWAAIASAGLIVYHYFSPSLTNYLANHPHISFWTFIVAVVVAFYSQSPILPTHAARKAPALKPTPQDKEPFVNRMKAEEPRCPEQGYDPRQPGPAVVVNWNGAAAGCTEEPRVPAPDGYIDPNGLRSDYKYTIFTNYWDSLARRFSITRLAKKAGFTGQDLITAVEIAFAESSGNPNAIGDSGHSFGLWQIDRQFHPEFKTWKLLEPQANACAAYAVYCARNRTFQPWSTFNDGKYLAHASDASADAKMFS